MVSVELVARYELLRGQYEQRLKGVGLFTEDEELQRMDAELIELESQLPVDYRYSGPGYPYGGHS